VFLDYNCADTRSRLLCILPLRTHFGPVKMLVLLSSGPDRLFGYPRPKKTS